MRIISGTYKGRNLKVPNTKFTRPTTDRVRETIFNILKDRISFEDISVLDIYAGSGSLGLEALSRGAASIHFVEKNLQIYKILQLNIDSIGAADQCNIFKMDAIQFSNMSAHQKYDLIFADPPFYKYEIHEVAKNIMAHDFLEDGGIFLIERSIQTREKDVTGFGIEPFKRIGDTLLYQFEK